jgi:hypothetical protein
VAAERSDMKLEDRVMRGNVFYIHSVQNEDSRIIFKFLGDPNLPDIVRMLTFSNIKDYRDEWYDRDDECTEMLMGIHESQQGEGVNYMLHTGQREIFFYTETEPKVEDVAPNAT